MHSCSAYNGDKPYIFVSYSHKDTDIVMQMISQMSSDGYRVWYDEGIKPGADWDEYIANKINNSGMFMAFVSKNYLDSDNCKDELNYSRDRIDNILLVYLSEVSLPSGMEMRFGRSQAIPAYNYSSKEEFFRKLYSSHGIDAFKESISPEEIPIPVKYAIPAPSAPSSASAAKKPAEAKSTAEQKQSPKPQKSHKKNYRKFIVGGVIALLAVIVIVIAAMSLPLILDEGDRVTSRGSSRTTRDRDETTSSSSGAEVTTLATTADVLGEDEGGGYEHDHMFSAYNLMDGETYYNVGDFFDNTGAVYIGYYEGDSYQGGFFHATDSMSVRIPALNDYSEPVNVTWYYIDANNDAQYLFSENNVVPVWANEEMSYVFSISSSVSATGQFQMGTYYVTVSSPSDGMVLTVSRFFYIE